jgi:hypothetical protein
LYLIDESPRLSIQFFIMQSNEKLSSTCSPSPAAADRSARAKGRWKLLRAALLREAVPDEASSIHQFPGYSSHLIPCEPVVAAADLLKSLEDALNDERDEEKVALAVWALLALEPKRCLWTIPIRTNFQQERLSLLLSPHMIEFQSDPSPMLLLTPYFDANDVQVKCYSLSHANVYTRERSRTARKSLHELTSHHHAQTEAIDNTGNICVWDCEIVLAWYLWQPGSRRIAQGTTLLEVGAGMAGVAALAGDGICSQIFITDGHTDCVWNNRINLRLLRQANSTGPSHIECSILRWSYNDGTLLCSADSTLVSDCTHFQEWHGQLLWTILRHTRVGGSIWICQPNRGQSWSRFHQLMERTVLGNIASIQEHRCDRLDELHAQFQLEHSSSYEPDRHRPRIFQIRKVGEVTLQHRDAIQEHIRIRDSQRD